MSRTSSGIFISVLIIFVAFLFRDIGLHMIFNFDAFLIVIGGTTIALFIGFPAKRIHDTVHHIIRTFSHQRDKESVINDILDLARKQRKIHIKGIENWMKTISDNYLKLGCTLLINDYEHRDIKMIMQREMMLKTAEYNFSQNLLKTVARLTPSFGLAGTVISLIKIFHNFNSVDTIASSMAVALMSTLYGVIIANLFMLPLCAKLKEKAIVSESIMLITIEGILSIKNNDHPLIIEEKLRGYQEENNSILPEIDNVKIVTNQAEVMS